MAKIVIGGALGFVVLQIFPARRFGIHLEDVGRNPPERFTIDAPADVLSVMHRACWDCHTNETTWPLYARLAPSSWLLAHDIHNARNHVNFSKWAEIDEKERQADREDCWEQIEKGSMPPWYYVYPMHIEAKLSGADKVLLKSWLMKDGTKKTADRR